MILPPEAHDLVQVLALHFTSPTYQRFATLMVARSATWHPDTTPITSACSHAHPGPGSHSAAP
jgi:hypothetical protein